MLVIVSDLHFSDGTTGGTVAPGAVQLFIDRVYDMALRASWRAGGAYRPLERLDIVLLGDVLDLIRTNQWLQTGARPWDAANAELAQTTESIVEAVLQHNAEALNGLRALATQPLLALPPANHAGLPALAVQRHEVDVRLHYMVGDHDWMLHLPGSEFHGARKRVVDALGLCQTAQAPFPHDALESPELLDVLRKHRVLARHGDVFDPLHCGEERAASSLADAISIELINRFCLELQRHYSEDLPRLVRAGLREVDNIRPILMVPLWIDSLLERATAAPSMRKKVRQVWDQMVEELLELDLVRLSESTSPFKVVDGLQMALKFSSVGSMDWPRRTAQWLRSVRGATDESFLEHALSEPDYRNRRARHIVYGHTHLAETTPMEATFADGYVLQQTYFNTGSWRRVYRQAQGTPKSHTLMPVECLNFAAFFRDDERGGRTFETWSGVLDASGPERWMHRIDGPEHASPESVSTSGVSLRGPHFHVSTVERGTAAAVETGR